MIDSPPNAIGWTGACLICAAIPPQPLRERHQNGAILMTTTMMKQSVFPTPMAGGLFEVDLPVKLGFEGSRVALRAMFRLVGASFILSAPGLWLLPGVDDDTSLMLYKLGASLFFLFCGMALILRNKTYAQPEVFFDPVKREMRILQPGEGGRPRTVLRRSYDTLGAARITRNHVEIWDVDGSVLINVPLHDPDMRSALRMQLGTLCRS